MPKQPRDEDRIKNMVISGMQAEMETGGLDMVMSVLKDGDGKQCTVQEIREIETQLVLGWRLKEKISEKEIKDRLRIYRQGMGLPFETKEEARTKVISHEIRDWVDSLSGTFTIQDLYKWMPELSQTSKDRHKISAYLSKLVNDKIIEKNGRYGHFRKPETDIEKMDFAGSNEKGVDIWLPFNLGDYADLMPGGIMLIAGEQDTGKTTIALNIAWANRNMWDVHYFNSELGAGALKRKTLLFKNTEPFQWQEKISFYTLSHDFQDFIVPGPDKLNIIDFMEASGDDYPYVAGWIKQIHDKIVDNGAIVVICLQKPPGRDEAVGGRGTLDKPRIYLAVGRGTMKIVRAKDWVTDMNPRDLALNFKIVGGADLIPTSDWEKTDKWRL